MITTCSIRCFWGSCVLSLGSLFFFAAIVLGGDVTKREKEPAGGNTAKPDAKEAARMVEAIANRNKKPEIVKRRRSYPNWLPLYPKDYDWKEEARVHKSLAKLEDDTSVEVWEALVQKANDPRYCFIAYSGSSPDAHTESVGLICHGLAYGRLCAVFEEHLPARPPHGRLFYLEKVSKDLAEWRKERKDKSLYELQIEVCEMALGELPNVAGNELSPKEKAEAKKKIEAEIAKLHQTKRPVFRNPSGGCSFAYPRKEAERVRDAHEKGALEEFQSNIYK